MSHIVVRIHPDALEETEAAVAWYARRSIRASERFLDELEGLIDKIQRHAAQFAEYVFGTRKVVFAKFPYLIVFRETVSGIEVIAVAHGRRRPGYWKERLE